MDGFVHLLESDFLFKEPVRLNIDAQLTGKVGSLFTGQCNLGSSKYKIGHTYSPTCICLDEDESVHHFLFRWKLYSNLRAGRIFQNDTETINILGQAINGLHLHWSPQRLRFGLRPTRGPEM